MANTLVYPNRDAWLVGRRDGIGGSDAPAILGIGYRTPLDVWADKLGIAEPVEESDAMWWGTRCEPLIVEKFGLESGLLVTRRENQIHVDPEHDCLRYSPDAFVVDETMRTVALVEIKRRSEFRAAEFEDAPPDRDYAQVQHGLSVTGLKLAYLVALFGSTLKWWKIEVDPLWHENRATLVAFWTDCVVPQVPPALTPDDNGLASRLFPQDEGEAVSLDEDSHDDTFVYIQAIEAQKDAKTTIDEIRARMRQRLGSATKGIVTGVGIWTLGKAGKSGTRTLRFREWRDSDG